MKAIIEEWDGEKTTRKLVENPDARDVNAFLAWLQQAHPNASVIGWADYMSEEEIRRATLHC